MGGFEYVVGRSSQIDADYQWDWEVCDEFPELSNLVWLGYCRFTHEVDLEIHLLLEYTGDARRCGQVAGPTHQLRVNQHRFLCSFQLEPIIGSQAWPENLPKLLWLEHLHLFLPVLILTKLASLKLLKILHLSVAWMAHYLDSCVG